MKTMPPKKASVLLLVLLLCIGLTACGSSKLLDQARSELRTGYPDYDKVLELLDDVSDKKQPEVQQLLDECYFGMGCRQLFMSYDPAAAAEAFARCVDHSQADFYLNAAQCMSEGDLSGTMNAISQVLGQQEQFHTADEWLYILQYTISSEVFDRMTLEERFALEKTLQTVCPSNARSMEDAARQISEKCQKTERNLEPLQNNINNYTLDSATYNDLEDLCTGTGVRPKVLIVRFEQVARRNNFSYTIAFDLMRQLPTPYIPTSLEEVNTLLLIKQVYSPEGYYPPAIGAYRLGVEMWLESRKENLGNWFYTVDSHQEIIWGPNTPTSIPSDYKKPHLIADHPDITNALQEMFSTRF